MADVVATDWRWTLAGTLLHVSSPIIGHGNHSRRHPRNPGWLRDAPRLDRILRRWPPVCREGVERPPETDMTTWEN